MLHMFKFASFWYIFKKKIRKTGPDLINRITRKIEALVHYIFLETVVQM